MQELGDIIDCYNNTAKNYADKFIDELNKKHLDRILLNSFAVENINNGGLIDLGCGPGQTTKFLSDCGMTDLIGVDIAPGMITVARKINPQLQFETADILQLPFPDASFGSAIAFYAIVHFDEEHVKKAFREINRVLTDKGQFLFSFHIGDNSVHLDEFLDHKVNIDFYFFEPHKIINLLTESGFEIIDILERAPYPNVEYPSKRAYIWVRKNNY